MILYNRVTLQYWQITESSSDCAVTTVPSPPADIVQVMIEATMSPSDPSGITGSVELTSLLLSYGQLPETTQCLSDLT